MARDLYLLRRYFGISAEEALNDEAEWEIDLLLEQLDADLAAAASAAAANAPL